MTAAAIPLAIAPRVGALLRLLGSDHDGEALGAARALRRTLGGVGLDLHALADAVEYPAVPVVVFRDRPEPRGPRQRRKARPNLEPQPGDVVLDRAEMRAVGEALWRAQADGQLTEWERTFATSIAERLNAGRGRLTERQGEALRRLLDKIGEAKAWA